MIFSENIIKFLYDLPEDFDISEQMNNYYGNILLSATQAIEIFNAAFPDQLTTDFIEYSDALNINFEKGEYDSALQELAYLQTNEDFNKIIEEYINQINKNLIDVASEGDENFRDKFIKYLEDINDEYLLNYIKFIDVVEQIEGTKPIEIEKE